ncbi:aromatic amino acid ammonia-lyase [Geobacillus zalihae]|uniref:aromatic amino acid ammonia-lyase n=1 Tax=Geobacillus zalihae TaxID=213419 RepID=UPI0021E0CE7D|nr:aromatic amino acid ammonia-lyase [Geobacillus zalihae]
MAVVRYGAQVEFSDEYCRRVQKSRKLLEQWIQQGRIMYGVNTGFGALAPN